MKHTESIEHIEVHVIFDSAAHNLADLAGLPSWDRDTETECYNCGEELTVAHALVLKASERSELCTRLCLTCVEPIRLI